MLPEWSRRLRGRSNGHVGGSRSSQSGISSTTAPPTSRETRFFEASQPLSTVPFVAQLDPRAPIASAEHRHRQNPPAPAGVKQDVPRIRRGDPLRGCHSGKDARQGGRVVGLVGKIGHRPPLPSKDYQADRGSVAALPAPAPLGQIDLAPLTPRCSPRGRVAAGSCTQRPMEGKRP